MIPYEPFLRQKEPAAYGVLGLTLTYFSNTDASLYKLRNNVN